jgi:O-antigen ligase
MYAVNPSWRLLDDLKLAESDEVNLRQRYIEWQAEINLLQERTVTGTGAGCINDYRSNFYYRLPKLNTLKAFDQNGWLAVGAETGIVGLVCFCWIVLYYGKAALNRVTDCRYESSHTDRRFAVAGLAGIAAASVANLFSSVHHNGILIAFVLVLGLISGANSTRKGIKC